MNERRIVNYVRSRFSITSAANFHVTKRHHATSFFESRTKDVVSSPPRKQGFRKRIPLIVSLGIVLVPLPSLGGNAQTIHRLRLHRTPRQNLDEVPVGIFDEGQPLHPARVGRFVEGDPQGMETFAGPIDVGHGDSQVTEPCVCARFAVVVSG